MAPFVSRVMFRVSLSSSSSSPRRKPVSKVNRKHCRTEKSHDPEARRVVIKGLDPAGDRPPSKMPDKVRRTSGKAQNPEESGKEMSHNVEELGVVVTERKTRG